MYKIDYSTQFRKDIKKIKKSGRFKSENFNFVVDILACGKQLPLKYRDHQLRGRLSELRECHIGPDLLLIYKIMNKVMVLYMIRIGSHSELF